jgi:NADH dehydrogenase [ubiquinone] 1 alpha subcomplex assembly factor 7
VTEQAATAIRDAIRDHGPITFAELMQHALYGPGGFYEHPPVGPEGDFVTSPHVHPIFATLVARAIRGLWEDLGRPDPYRIVEAGAGDGTLARQLLAELDDVPVAYAAVEATRGARDALTRIEGIAVTATVEPPVDLVLANELLDNLPFRVVRGEQEVRIGLRGDRFVEILVAIDDELGRVARLADGDEPVVIPVGALAFVDHIAATLERGHALLIDYGSVGSAGGPFHGYRGHGVVEDVLAAPGSSDITSGVDFGIVAERARAHGLTTFPTVTQHDALLALGLQEWLHAELEHQRELLTTREGAPAVRTWAGRSRATLLADPAGLGRFRWLLIATPGLPRPGWLVGTHRPQTD